MKQYLSPEQTAKLIKLGLPKPRYYCVDKYTIIHTGFEIINYSIGELIEMLNSVSELEIIRFGSGWEAGDDLRAFQGEELIDALYDMIIKLKEDGVI